MLAEVIAVQYRGAEVTSNCQLLDISGWFLSKIRAFSPFPLINKTKQHNKNKNFLINYVRKASAALF